MKPLNSILDVAAALAASGSTLSAGQLQDAVAELRRELPETGLRMAWAAVVCTLYKVRPDWDETAGKTSMENAVAAIRSMAAQCSAQPAPVIPLVWPEPITREQLNALAWAQGYLSGTGYDRIVESLAGVEQWLRKHGCDQIR